MSEMLSSQAKNTPKLSIVVPCCNVEKYLDQCLSSIVNQTLKEIEIICINDGSKDGTLGIIKSYAAKDDRIVILDKPNSGYGDSMNKGFNMANGEYIGIVESDDFIEPDMFRTLYETAKQFDADVVKSNFWFYWSNPEKNELHEYFKRKECGKVICPREYDGGSLFGRKPSIWSAIYKKSFIREKNIGFLPTPGASFQDTSFTFKVYSSAERMVCLYDAFLHYRQDNENSSVNNADKKAYCICDEYNEIKKYILEHEDMADDLYPIYGAAFYDTCIWMYERLSPEKRRTYIFEMSQWFSELLDECDIESLDFGEAWWKSRDMLRIVDDPLEYHVWRNTERYKQGEDKIKYDITSIPLNNLADVLKKQQAKEHKPMFSVIMPVYNCEKFLQSAYDSLALQTMEDFEVICINDGSKDHSLSVLEKLAKQDERIVIINKPNEGPAKARNVGIEAAIGQYIIFLDSDDYYDIHTCERLSEEISSVKKFDAIVFGGNIFPEVPRASDWLYDVLTTPNAYYEKITEKDMLTEKYFKVYSWRVCFDAEFIKKNKLGFNPDFKYGEDALFMFDALTKMEGVLVISDKLYNYRHYNPDSLMNGMYRQPEKYANEQLRILRQLLTVAKEDGIKPSAELLQYSCDFIFSAVDNCPMPAKLEIMRSLIALLKEFELYDCVDEATSNCRGFIEYCNNELENSHTSYSLSSKFKTSMLKIVPPSRYVYYDNTTKLINQIAAQQRSLDALQRQVAELKTMIKNMSNGTPEKKKYGKNKNKKF